MDGNGERQRAAGEPRGFLPRTSTTAPPWRGVRDWLFGDRADIDQEGLLAGRTLPIRPSRTSHPEADEAAG
jgi:hypothetical protein